MRVMLLYLSLTAFIGGVLTLNLCEKQTTCYGCIREPSGCAWCSLVSYAGTRCMPQNANLTSCGGHIENPESKKIEPTKPDFNQKQINSKAGNVRQIRPQQYKLKLRLGQPFNLSFSFAAAEDYPVDVYFLLDASLTMKVTKGAAVAQIKKIHEILHNATKHVFLGLGTFIDKNTLPYTVDVSSQLAYSFKHRVKLNGDYKVFQEAMNNTEFGRNRDSPEGGLDALAQVMVCKDEIGWRTESRKIIIMLTDGPYHAAGDGRSGGIFQPYDGLCHTVNGRYTKELIMDYPSVAMINKLAKDNDFIIIFAVGKSAFSALYTNLAENISGAQMNLIENGQENNIVQILISIYEKISKQIKLKVNKVKGQKNDFKVKFDPDCTWEGNSACKINVGKVLDFNATITLPEYAGSDTASIDIGIEGISEKLSLDIDIIKDCGCEHEPKKISDLFCNGEIVECGICKCREPKYGDNCRCNRNQDNKAIDSNGTCVKDGDEIECSGKGKCSCGKCECSEGRLGKYCECDSYECPRGKGFICSNHGECQCDKTCKCDVGWYGPSCEYSEDFCKKDGKVCNNRGTCGDPLREGNCACEDPADWDSRQENNDFCYIIPCKSCHEQQCALLFDCVACTFNQQEPCCLFTNQNLKVEIVDSLNKTDDIGDLKEWKNCTNARVDIGCYANFMYAYDDNNYGILVKIHKDKNCLENYLIYGGIFLLTLIIVGVGTLVTWKLLTDARDHREYQRFVKSQNVEDICQNPLYEPASTTFRNPVFGQKSAKY